MTDTEKLKRYPSVILRRAMTHLRKRYIGSRDSNGRENMRILKAAIARVEVCHLNTLMNSLRNER